jgi:hypothetical protein
MNWRPKGLKGTMSFGGSTDTIAPRTAALSMERIPSKKITWIMI